VVLCVCRLYRRKRVDLLLRAAAELQSRIPRFELRIAGEGPERNGTGSSGSGARSNLGRRFAGLGLSIAGRLARVRPL
jgi:glycosyltransferase involved in cell wall biosynthesis